MGKALNYVVIGRRIKYYRDQRGITVENLTSKAAVSAAHLIRIEAGKSKVALQVLVNIADALNIKLDLLLNDAKKASAYHMEILELLKNSTKEEQKLLYETLKLIQAFLNTQK